MPFDIEARVRWLERALHDVSRRADSLDDKWGLIEQQSELDREAFEGIGSACTGTIDVTVTYLGSPVVGATVTLSGAGTGSGTTNSSGFVSIAITAAGTYTVTVSAMGCVAAASTTVTATCSTNATSVAQAVPASKAQIAFTVRGCTSTSVLLGAVVTATRGSNTYTGTTNSSGQVTLDVSPSGAGSYSWSVAPPNVRFSGTSGTVTAGACGTTATVTTSLGVATGYHCGGGANPCSFPLADTLYLTNSKGTVTLTYNGATSKWEGVQGIAGVSTVSADCPGAPLPLNRCGGAAAAGSMGMFWAYNGGGTGGAPDPNMAGSFYKACVDASLVGHPIDVSSFLTTHCTGGGQTGKAFTSIVCPPSFLYTGTIVEANNFSGLNNATFTISE